MEQVRMAPIGTFPFVVGKTVPYFFISLASAALIILASMVLFGLPMRGNWLSLLLALSLFLVGALGDRTADLDGRRDAAGRLSAGAADLAAADADAVGLHLSDLAACRGAAGHHPRRAGALFPHRAARHRAEGRTGHALLSAAGGPGALRHASMLSLASLRLARERATETCSACASSSGRSSSSCG